MLVTCGTYTIFFFTHHLFVSHYKQSQGASWECGRCVRARLLDDVSVGLVVRRPHRDKPRDRRARSKTKRVGRSGKLAGARPKRRTPNCSRADRKAAGPERATTLRHGDADVWTPEAGEQNDRKREGGGEKTEGDMRERWQWCKLLKGARVHADQHRTPTIDGGRPSKGKKSTSRTICKTPATLSEPISRTWTEASIAAKDTCRRRGETTRGAARSCQLVGARRMPTVHPPPTRPSLPFDPARSPTRPRSSTPTPASAGTAPPSTSHPPAAGRTSSSAPPRRSVPCC